MACFRRQYRTRGSVGPSPCRSAKDIRAIPATVPGGQRSLLDVLDAERTYFNIRFERVSAQSSYTFSQYRLLASQGMLAKHFKLSHANVALAPDFKERATRAKRPAAIFNTEIRALE